MSAGWNKENAWKDEASKPLLNTCLCLERKEENALINSFKEQKPTYLLLMLSFSCFFSLLTWKTCVNTQVSPAAWCFPEDPSRRNLLRSVPTALYSHLLHRVRKRTWEPGNADLGHLLASGRWFCPWGQLSDSWTGVLSPPQGLLGRFTEITRAKHSFRQFLKYVRSSYYAVF